MKSETTYNIREDKLAEDHCEYKEFEYDYSSFHSSSRQREWLPTVKVELTGRWRVVKSEPKVFHLLFEYFYTPKKLLPIVTHRYYGASGECNETVEMRLGKPAWEDIGSDLEIRPIKRGWIEDMWLDESTTFIPELGEIQECD